MERIVSYTLQMGFMCTSLQKDASRQNQIFFVKIQKKVGCMRGCRFCATGAMGIVRNLAAPVEILKSLLATQVAV